jgi:hypothetical protein
MHASLYDVLLCFIFAYLVLPRGYYRGFSPEHISENNLLTLLQHHHQ